MKFTNIYKISATSLLAISLAIMPLMKVRAQINSEPEIEVIETEDDDFDWGLLGLLGLLGLAGLGGKNKHDNRETVNTQPFPETPRGRSDL